MGSGKTTVCDLFSTLDIPVYNADERAKALMVSDADLKQGIIALLGEDAYSDQTLNRKFIAKQIFSDPQKLDLLNGLVHPKVYQDLDKWFEACPAPYALYESALIVHHQSDQRSLDYLIYVYTSQEQRVRRILQRNGVSKKEILDRMESQPDPVQVIQLADYVVINEDRKLIPQILAIHKDLIAKT